MDQKEVKEEAEENPHKKESSEDLIGRDDLFTLGFHETESHDLHS